MSTTYSPHCIVETSEKRNLAVRLVRKGESYGRDDVLTHNEDEPVIDFFYADYVFPKNVLHPDKANMPGRFTDVTCYVSAIFDKKYSTGLSIESGFLTLSRKEIRELRELLFDMLSTEEKERLGIALSDEEINEPEPIQTAEDIFGAFVHRYSDEEIDKYWERKNGLSDLRGKIDHCLEQASLIESDSLSGQLLTTKIKIDINSAKASLLQALKEVERYQDEHENIYLERQTKKSD